MNPIAKASLIDNKIHQFVIAQSHGFNIPQFVYTNRKDRLINFAYKHEIVALKFMAQEMYKVADGSYQGLYVNKIVPDELKGFGEAQENPVFLQKYVQKSFEVRYTYVENKHFVCRIDSQANSVTEVDWRRYNIAETPHEAFDAPPTISNQIHTFMQDVGLAYGAFDFIVDKSDKWWYLEVNSAGQWLWIEDLTRLAISSAIANCLIQHDREV